MNGEIVQATNNFLLLNPLVDPLIYLFRIKEVRCQCVCRSCFQSYPTTTTTQEATASTDAGMSNNLEQQQTAWKTSGTIQLTYNVINIILSKQYNRTI